MDQRKSLYWFNLGNAFVQKSTPDAEELAKGAFEKALSLSPEDGELLVNYGLLTRNRDMLRKGSKRSSRGRTALAQLLFEEGNLEQAVEEFAAAVSLNPESVELNFQQELARWHLWQKRHVGIVSEQEGEKEFTRVFAEVLGRRNNAWQRWGFLAKGSVAAAALGRKKWAEPLKTALKHELAGLKNVFASDKVKAIRAKEADPSWQAKFAVDCLQTWAAPAVVQSPATAGGTRSSTVGTAGALFPDQCAYTVVWATSWQRVLLRIEDGALDAVLGTGGGGSVGSQSSVTLDRRGGDLSSVETEKNDYRHITENFGVAVEGSGLGGACVYAWLLKRECVTVDVLCDAMGDAGDLFYCKRGGQGGGESEHGKNSTGDLVNGVGGGSFRATVDVIMRICCFVVIFCWRSTTVIST